MPNTKVLHFPKTETTWREVICQGDSTTTVFARCAGGCGAIVASRGAFCLSCAVAEGGE